MHTSHTSDNWFEVDRKGLSSLVANRDKSFVINELIQNAWDQNVTKVNIRLDSSDTRGYSTLIVEDDDPNGFSDMAHAFTLFAESEKKSDATKRGRFNLGEKLVLSVCKEAKIETVGRTIVFTSEGKRQKCKNDRSQGSRFTAIIKMTKAEREEIIAGCSRLIPPEGIETTLNDVPLLERKSVASYEIQMPTVGTDSEGNLFSTKRSTKVNIYETKDDEQATIYEMGIPIVSLEEDRFHVDIQQKVPLNMDRDNVQPSYLRRLRMSVVNNTTELLTKEDSAANWVSEATGHPEASKESVNKVLDLRYGKKRVMFDPSDPEANARAQSAGYAVIYGRSLTADQHRNAKEYGSVSPAGQVTPSPKPYSEDGTPLKDMEKITPEMEAVAGLAKRLASKILACSVSVRFVNDVTWPFAATYGTGCLVFNVGRLGRKFFNSTNMTDILDLLIHEFGHHYESNHLSDSYYKALTKIGARIAKIALDEPDTFLLR